MTKFNRCRLELPKEHWIDAACVGDVDSLELVTYQPLLIQSSGHGNRQMCGTDKYGFPIRHRSREKIQFGFQTGDIVQAVVEKATKLKSAGEHVGRVSVRASGSFDIKTKEGRQQGISYKDCSIIHKKDGYNYAF